MKVGVVKPSLVVTMLKLDSWRSFALVIYIRCE